MKQLIKFEMLKVFQQKGIYFIGFLVLLLITVVSPHHSPNVEQYYKPYEGEITHAKINKAEKENAALMKSPSLTSNQMLKEGVLEEFAVDNHLQSTINETISNLRKSNSSASKLEQSMLNKLKFSTFYNSEPAQKTIDFVGHLSFVFSGLLILIGLSTIFTRESSCGVDQYILTSKLGRKSIVTAKLIAAMTYLLVVACVWVLYDLIFNLYVYGNSGWKSPIQYFTLFNESPYHFSTLHFFVIEVTIALIGSLGFTIMVLLVSALCNNALTSFFISGVLFAMPVAWTSVLHKPSNCLTIFSYTNIMRVELLFNKFHAYTFFGQAVLQPIVVLGVSILVSLAFVYFIYVRIRNKEVTA
jgi:hypothetical protein